MGVFVSPTLVELQEAIIKVPPDLVQIHGDLEEELFKETDISSVCAIPVQEVLGKISSQADYLLLDVSLAGSGKTFSWELLKDRKITKPYFLAGRLTVDNVQQTITLFHSYAIGVSSDVETGGKRDLLRIIKFVESIKR